MYQIQRRRTTVVTLYFFSFYLFYTPPFASPFSLMIADLSRRSHECAKCQLAAFLRAHRASLRAIDFDPSEYARNIERNYGQFIMPMRSSPSSLPYSGGRAVRRPAGPVIARRWIGPRIDCFRDSVRYCENATN